MRSFNLRLLIMLVFMVFIIMQVKSCLTNSKDTVETSPKNILVQVSELSDLGEGLDLEALGLLLNEVSTAAELESKLNQKGSINNLDLNQDGVVDFINVKEVGEGKERGFILTTELSDGKEQEIVQVILKVSQNQSEKGEVQIKGNQSVYGANHYYHSRSSFSNMLLMAWLFSPHPRYYSPYGRGYYPAYYGRGYSSVPTQTYQTRSAAKKSSMQGNSKASYTQSTKPKFQSKISASQASKPSSSRRSLRSPTRSQKSFRSNNIFSSSSRGRSIRGSTSMRSGSSFGGGK